MSQRIAYTVRGTVQGVNFRYYTAREANKISVTGFVKNDDGGTVSGEAQGTESNLEKFLELIKQGPPSAKVSAVDHSKIDIKDSETRFEQYR